MEERSMHVLPVTAIPCQSDARPRRVPTPLRAIRAPFGWLVFALCLVALPAGAVTIDPTNLGWTVQYMIDNSQMSQPTGGYLQTTEPRDNRGLALSPDGNFLYAGYNSRNGGGEVRRIDMTKTSYTDATVAVLPGHRGKAIATDDLGRVYLGDGNQVAIYDANLTTLLATVPGFTAAEGISVDRRNGQLSLYVTDRGNGTNPTSLSQFTVQEGVGDAITAIGSQANLTPSGATELRGVEVDPSGNVWAADFGASAIYELVTATNSTNTFNGINTPMDIAFDDAHAFVTQYKNRQITILDPSSGTAVATVTPPWGTLALDPDGQSQHTSSPPPPGQPDLAPGNGALSGIDIAGGLLYVTNEAGQTENGRSLWGALDSASGIAGGIQYTDLNQDDNEPILVAGNTFTTPDKLLAAQVPEPTSLLLVASTGLLLIARRRRAGATAPFLKSAI